MTSRRVAVLLANLLFVSVAANLFLAGWISSQSFYRPPPPSGPLAGIDRLMKERLSKDGYERIHALIEQVRPHFHEMESGTRITREKMIEALEAPQFDKPAFDEALAEIMRTRNEFDSWTIHNASEALQLLGRDDRRAVGRIIERGPLGPPGPPPPPR
ncbi:heavy-metal resistance protein [Breoghania corrubedonensis]|uniref:Heavy-metal resistance protein n=1 Tax=Breoghania corrubedonensis TaxID=665038 RepID=A0A2T5V6F1_9HYPH|nr:periplasmic heavy metal sensor [Breoghania corrubedonensis]PTW59333.1 heavy-metal resistance protein [Breoghania corrubedonensis]